MNTAQDRVNAINLDATRRTDRVIKAWNDGHLTDAERDADLNRLRMVAAIRVQLIRAGN